MSIPTPHIAAESKDAFGKTVLMPGDPLRAKYIAENFLTDPVLVNNIRGVNGYTGTWKGVKVSVMASGMGMPAIGIYTWELFNFYDVDNIIRVGSAGAFADELDVMDIVAAQASCTNSNYVNGFGVDGNFAPIADFNLLMAAVDSAKEIGVKLHVGNVLSSDNFYYADGHDRKDEWKNMGVLATEMESAALYCNAAYAHKRGLCLCTISDHLYKEQYLSPEARQTTFDQMITIALDTAVKMENM